LPQPEPTGGKDGIMKQYKLFVTQDQLDMIEGWALTHWMKYKDEDDRALIDDLLPRIKKAADEGNKGGK
jgi:hypothetical protein